MRLAFETLGACFSCRWPPFGFLWSPVVLYHRACLLRNDDLAFVEAVDDASECIDRCYRCSSFFYGKGMSCVLMVPVLCSTCLTLGDCV